MHIQSWGKTGTLAYSGLEIGYSAILAIIHIFRDMDFIFVLRIIYIDIKEQTLYPPTFFHEFV